MNAKGAFKHCRYCCSGLFVHTFLLRAKEENEESEKTMSNQERVDLLKLVQEISRTTIEISNKGPWTCVWSHPSLFGAKDCEVSDSPLYSCLSPSSLSLEDHFELQIFVILVL
jgi:hypothetical protein